MATNNSVDNISQLVAIDRKIDKSEKTGLRERWEFGRLMVEARDGRDRLPNGYLTKLIACTGKSRSELEYRSQFAEKYPSEEELSNALDSFSAWREVVKTLGAAKGDGAKPQSKPLKPAGVAKRLENDANDLYELAGRLTDFTSGEIDKLQGAAVTVRNAAEDLINEVNVYDSSDQSKAS